MNIEKGFFGGEIRNSIEQIKSNVGHPLFTLEFYEPQSELDVCYDKVENELQDPDIINIHQLDSVMPKSRPASIVSLEELAKYAFPVTKTEKGESARYLSGRLTKAAAKKAAPKKAAPKKAAA